MEQSIQEIVRALIEKIGATIIDFRTEEDSLGSLNIIIETNENRLLIGEEGSKLQALNYIAKRIAEQKGLETTFHIDIGGYASSYRRKLSDTAKIFAERARYFKSPVHMEPMNPYDRLIIHDALSQLHDISTQSEGTGMSRHVVISYKGEGDAHSI